MPAAIDVADDRHRLGGGDIEARRKFPLGADERELALDSRLIRGYVTPARGPILARSHRALAPAGLVVRRSQ